jgi:anti-sigma B factor antagonist
VSKTGTPGQLEIEHVSAGATHTLVLKGELDLASAPTLAQVVREPPSDSANVLALDLSRLTFLDSTGLRATVEAGELCRERGQGFLLVPGPRQVQRVFEIAGLLDVLPFGPDLDDSPS